MDELSNMFLHTIVTHTVLTSPCSQNNEGVSLPA